MRKKKNNLDERQEMTLLQIEHRGCWLTFGMLFIVLMVQTMLNVDYTYIAGELIVFTILCIYLVGACIKNGIWDRRWKPTVKTNLALSGGSGLITGILYSVTSYCRFHQMDTAIIVGVMMFVSVAILSFATLALFLWLYKKRVKKIEQNIEDENKSL